MGLVHNHVENLAQVVIEDLDGLLDGSVLRELLRGEVNQSDLRLLQQQAHGVLVVQPIALEEVGYLTPSLLVHAFNLIFCQRLSGNNNDRLIHLRLFHQGGAVRTA